MKPSSESSATESKEGTRDLELPIELGFRPLPPLVSMDVMIQRIAELREMFPQGIPTEEERLAAKVSEPFEL